jgi:hypothetical protein
MRAALVIVSFLLALEIGSRIRNPFPFRVRGDHIVLRRTRPTRFPTWVRSSSIRSDGARLVGDIVFSQLQPWLVPGTRS